MSHGESVPDLASEFPLVVTRMPWLDPWTFVLALSLNFYVIPTLWCSPHAFLEIFWEDLRSSTFHCRNCIVIVDRVFKYWCREVGVGKRWEDGPGIKAVWGIMLTGTDWTERCLMPFSVRAGRSEGLWPIRSLGQRYLGSNEMLHRSALRETWTELVRPYKLQPR